MFAQRAGWDRWAAKGVLFCRLQLPPAAPAAAAAGDDAGHGPAAQHGSEAPGAPSRYLDLYATHMQAGCNPAEQAARRRQAEQVARFICRHSGGTARAEDGGAPAVAGAARACSPVGAQALGLHPPASAPGQALQQRHGACACAGRLVACSACGGRSQQAQAPVTPGPAAGAARHPVVLAGDLNMGPCPDPSYQSFRWAAGHVAAGAARPCAPASCCAVCGRSAIRMWKQEGSSRDRAQAERGERL